MRKTARFSSPGSRGFTFIELLIVVSIITLLSAASIPGFSGYIKSQNVKQSLEQVKSDLRTAQIRSMAGSLSDESGVDYWAVKFTSGGSSHGFYTYTTLTTGENKRSAAEKLVGDVTVKNVITIFFRISDGDAFNTSGACNLNGANCRVIIGTAGATGNNCAAIAVNAAGGMFKQEGVACP